MGGCCYTQTELTPISVSIDQRTKNNGFLLNGLVLHFLDKEEFGMTLRLMKIQELTQSYYSSLQEQRHKLIRQNRIEDDEYFQRMMKRELSEVSCANKLLQYLFLSIIEEKQIEITQYIHFLENKYENSIALKKLYADYENSKSENNSFDEFAQTLKGDEALSYEQEIYIRRICQVTTYTFSTRGKRLTYN